MDDFVDTKFKYLTYFEEFKWMSYLTTRYPVHENLFRVFFNNAALEDADEEDNDLCRIEAINNLMMGVSIQVT